LVTLEAICGLVGSIAGFAINGVVKSLSALFGAVVNAIKSIHGLSTTKEGWSER